MLIFLKSVPSLISNDAICVETLHVNNFFESLNHLASYLTRLIALDIGHVHSIYCVN